VLFLNGSRIDFSERATIDGENRAHKDMVAYFVNTATIPVRITKEPAPNVQLKPFKETVSMNLRSQRHFTLHGNGKHFLYVNVMNHNLKKFNHGTKKWEELDTEIEVVNNSEVKCISLKYKQREKTIVGSEAVSIECFDFNDDDYTFKFKIETVPEKKIITATIGEYASER